MIKNHNGLFIVGSPRSGTTLLQSILASHSKLYSSPETSFFDRIIPRLGVEYYNPSHLISPSDLDVIMKDIHSMTGAHKHNLEFYNGMNIKTAFEQLIGCYNENEKLYWVEKTTNHARFMLAIQRFYPRAKFVHIIRDPVDSVASMFHIKPIDITDKRISYIPTISGLSALWCECVESAFMYPYQENVLHIHYEDLVLTPEPVLCNLCKFINIPFEKNMLEVFHLTAQNYFNAESCPWQNNNALPGFHNEAVHKWRRKLSIEQIWMIQRFTQPWVSRLGYYQNITCPFYKKIVALSFDTVKKYVNKSRIETIVRRIIL